MGVKNNNGNSTIDWRRRKCLADCSNRITTFAHTLPLWRDYRLGKQGDGPDRITKRTLDNSSTIGCAKCSQGHLRCSQEFLRI